MESANSLGILKAVGKLGSNFSFSIGLRVFWLTVVALDFHSFILKLNIDV